MHNANGGKKGKGDKGSWQKGKGDKGGWQEGWKGQLGNYLNPKSKGKWKLQGLSGPGAYSRTAQQQWEHCSTQGQWNGQQGSWDGQQGYWEAGMHYVDFSGQYPEMPRRLCMLEEARSPVDDDDNSECTPPRTTCKQRSLIKNDDSWISIFVLVFLNILTLCV